MQTETTKANGKKTSKKGRINAIGNFEVEKVDRDTMLAYIREHKLPLVEIDDAETEQIAVALSLHFREKLKEDDLLKCDECGGEGPEAADACPFCGSEGDPGEEAPAMVVAEESQPTIEQAAPKKTTKKAKAEEANMETVANGKAMTKRASDAVGSLTEKDLDKAVKEAIKLKTETAESYWELGKKILEINERNLWKLRVDDNGKARYSSFDSFVHAELNMTPGHAYGMMSWARTYTAEDLARIGRSKAVLLMKAPPEDREKLKEEALAGASHRELGKKVRAAKKKSGHAGGGGGKHSEARAKAGAKGAEARAKKLAAKKNADKITIAQIEGRKVVPLFAKPATMRNLDMSTLKKAKAIGDEPFGRLELANDAVMYISIRKNKDGTLSAVCDTRRETATSEEGGDAEE